MTMDDSWGTIMLVAAIVAALSSLIVQRVRGSQPRLDDTRSISAERSAASVALAQSLPDSVFFPPHPIAVESIQSYWAIQERDILPQCIVRPQRSEEVAIAVGLLKSHYDTSTRHATNPILFAVRGGGHSPIPGAANIDHGVVIDLRLLNKVVPSDDGSSVTIGTGARWLDVSKLSDEKGLAVAGGRNSAVGVGGLTSGGKCLVYTCTDIILFCMGGSALPEHPHC